ncbi:unnamed protein product [marine sediment metagenome]|uniref:Uncharacterized protein n=1 Tax=marine sediment metagenome TaxID=412755 RepID=X1VYC8_9ZZZZ
MLELAHYLKVDAVLVIPGAVVSIAFQITKKGKKGMTAVMDEYFSLS